MSSALDALFERNATGIPSGKMGMWVFLASEIMLFGAFISAYIVLRMGSPLFGVPTEEVLAPGIATINTFVLIVSSFTMVLAIAAIQKDNVKQFIGYMTATSILGMVFLGIKAYEYHHKIHEGLTISSSLFGSFYFTMTGLHALHMIGGLIFNAYIITNAFRGKYSSQYYERPEYAGLYWHFVDLVWVVLFPVFYLV